MSEVLVVQNSISIEYKCLDEKMPFLYIDFVPFVMENKHHFNTRAFFKVGPGSPEGEGGTR